MEKLPLVSIVTPSYNQGEFIEELILSIKSQDYPNIEHIIVDGASTDNTLAVIKKHEGTYNMRWTSEPDDGHYPALNKGLRQAQGEIWAFMCADDLYLPWAVSVAVEYLREHPEVEAVYGDIMQVNLETGRDSLVFYPRFRFPFFEFLPSPAAFLRKSVVEKVGLYDENMSQVGDYDYAIRVVNQCRVSKIEEILAIDRVHLDTLRSRNRQKIHEQHEQVRQRYGVPKGVKGSLFKVMDLVRSFIARRFLRIKFAVCYCTRPGRASSEGASGYSWQKLIEFPGFHMVSWLRFFIMIIPWVNRKYRGNCFVLNLEGGMGVKLR